VLADGQATASTSEVSAPIEVADDAVGEPQLKPHSFPLSSTSTHSVAETQATAPPPLGSTEDGVGVPEEVGLNVISLPLPSVVTHSSAI